MGAERSSASVAQLQILRGEAVRIGIEASRATLNGTGIDRHTVSLIKALNDVDSHNEYILFSNTMGLKEELGLKSNFSIEKLNKRFRMIRRPGISWMAKPFFRDLDLFHFPNSDIWYSKYCKTLATVHDLAPLHYPSEFSYSKNFYAEYEQCLKYIKKNADLILTVSDYSKKDIQDSLDIAPDRVVRIYNGVDRRFHKISDEGMQSTKTRLNIPDNFVLFVGSRALRKNAEALIRAFALVIKDSQYRDFKLLIVGNPCSPTAARVTAPLESISRELSLEGSVQFLKDIQDEELVILYNLATLFVFPSLHEGFGFPPLEAMACGCPVLCSDRCSLPEVAGEGAMFFNPQDIGQLSDSIIKLLRSRQMREDLSRRGMRRAAMFSWRETARKTIDVYQQLAEL